MPAVKKLERYEKISQEYEIRISSRQLTKSKEEPVIWDSFPGKLWIFKDFLYYVDDDYTNEQAKLLILENFDKERKHFEKLKLKFDSNHQEKSFYKRTRIPERVRIEVWRRDGGKCAICGSRVKLEYDHIVPISKGGSNTARNIELLCEKHNRCKSNNIA